MPDRPAPVLKSLTPKDVVYLLHPVLYGGVHCNPRKCEQYNTRVCECGKVHACPAPN